MGLCPRMDQQCPKGWWGNPTCGPCNCDINKGFDPDCNKTNGQCHCKVRSHNLPCPALPCPLLDPTCSLMPCPPLHLRGHPGFLLPLALRGGACPSCLCQSVWGVLL